MDIDQPLSPLTHAKDLIAKKDAIEEEISQCETTLRSQKIGMHEPLIDSQGFPRSDIDVVSVRTARVRLHELKNDLKNIMGEIEKALHEVHAHNAKVAQETKMQVDKAKAKELESSIPITPGVAFAKVNAIAPDSPAKEAGLEKGDLLLQIGNINSSNHQNLTKLNELVAGSENQTLAMRILRHGQQRQLTLTPHKGWGGRGLLGCHILPYSPPQQSNAPSMTFTVLYFAGAKDIAGVESETMYSPSTTLPISEFPNLLLAKHPKLSSILPTCMLSINLEYIDKTDADISIKQGDQVAVIPPVSGG